MFETTNQYVFPDELKRQALQCSVLGIIPSMTCKLELTSDPAKSHEKS